jgi:thiol-disulfide isomerase/thioredoxin
LDLKSQVGKAKLDFSEQATRGVIMNSTCKIAGITLVLLLITPLSFAVLETGDAFIPFSLRNIDDTVHTVTMEEGRLTVILTETRDGRERMTKTHPDAVLLDFWATWCVPCRKAMPHMQDLHVKYGQSEGQEVGGLRLFGIALDEKGSRVVRPFYQRLKITYPMLSDPTTGGADDGLIRTTQEMKKKYKVQEIPVVYIIDAKGTITHVHVGFKKEHVAELDRAVGSLVSRGNS